MAKLPGCAFVVTTSAVVWIILCGDARVPAFGFVGGAGTGTIFAGLADGATVGAATTEACVCFDVDALVVALGFAGGAGLALAADAWCGGVAFVAACAAVFAVGLQVDAFVIAVGASCCAFACASVALLAESALVAALSTVAIVCLDVDAEVATFFEFDRGGGTGELTGSFIALGVAATPVSASATVLVVGLQIDALSIATRFVVGTDTSPAFALESWAAGGATTATVKPVCVGVDARGIAYGRRFFGAFGFAAIFGAGFAWFADVVAGATVEGIGFGVHTFAVAECKARGTLTGSAGATLATGADVSAASAIVYVDLRVVTARKAKVFAARWTLGKASSFAAYLPFFTESITAATVKLMGAGVDANAVAVLFSRGALTGAIDAGLVIAAGVATAATMAIVVA